MSNPYESPKWLSDYLLFHYGTEEQILGGLPGPVEALGFAKRCVADLLDASSLPEGAVALDAGCAVGRSSFELARYCGCVRGIDCSAAFIQAAQILQRSGHLPYELAIEGDLRCPSVARPPDVPMDRVTFAIADATDLPAGFGPFDVVLAANLICRLKAPSAFLESLASLIIPGGQLLLATPFTWLEEFTPRENWLGGCGKDGARGFDVLKALLAPHFQLELTRDLPFLIREHARKFQYGISLGARWRRL